MKEFLIQPDHPKVGSRYIIDIEEDRASSEESPVVCYEGETVSVLFTDSRFRCDARVDTLLSDEEGDLILVSPDLNTLKPIIL